MCFKGICLLPLTWQKWKNKLHVSFTHLKARNRFRHTFFNPHDNPLSTAKQTAARMATATHPRALPPLLGPCCLQPLEAPPAAPLAAVIPSGLLCYLMFLDVIKIIVSLCDFGLAPWHHLISAHYLLCVKLFKLYSLEGGWTRYWDQQTQLQYPGRLQSSLQAKVKRSVLGAQEMDLMGEVCLLLLFTLQGRNPPLLLWI